MGRRGGTFSRLAIVVVLLVAWGSVFLGPQIGAAHSPTNETVFNASPVDPVGVAASPSQLLVTTPECLTQADYDGGRRRQVLSFDSSGNTTVFATFAATTRVGCFVEDIAIAPPSPNQPGFPSLNLAGFVSNRVYVTQGPNVMQIEYTGCPAGGSCITTFVTIASCPASGNGITFDSVGSFGPQGTMIVTCNNGGVWKVLPTSSGASTGTATFVATVPAFIEGPAVAPTSFTPCPGCLFVGSPSESTVYSVTPSGTVRKEARWPAVNGADFVPTPIKCTFQSTNGTYFAAIKATAPGNGALVKFPTGSAFSGLGGSALAGREFGTAGDSKGIGILSPQGNKVRVSTFHSFTAPLTPGMLGAAFVDCSVPTLVRIDVDPAQDPNILNLGSGGLVSVVVFGSAVLDTAQIVLNPPPTFGYFGTEQSFDHAAQGRKDTNGDGFLDLELFFRIPIAAQNVPPGTPQPIQWKLKGDYLGQTGDPRFEGGD
jgi:hypothetical protein